jgi:hypothetical protein
VVLPVLYLKGLSSGDFQEALAVVSRIFRTFDFVRGLRGLVSSGQAVVQ